MAMAGADLLVKIGADMTSLNKGLQQGQMNIGNFAKGVGKAFKVASVAVVGLGATLLAMTKSTANQADEIIKLSRKIGMAVEPLSALKHAAELSGSSIDTLGTGVRILARNAYDASQGTGEAKDAFEALGIEVTATDGKLKPTEQLLLDIAERFGEMKDGTKKTALAMDLLGRSGTDLIPMLNAGKKGLKAMTDKATALGITFTEELALAAEELNDNILELRRRFTGLKNTIGEKLFPVVNEIVLKMSDWIDLNKDLLAQNISGWIDKIVKGIQSAKPIFDAVLATLKGIVWAAEKVKTAAEWWGKQSVTAQPEWWAPFFGALPKYQSGTPYVTKTGPAMVHKGEKITSASENMATGGGQPSMTIHQHFSFPDTDTHLRHIARTLAPYIDQEIRLRQRRI